MTERACEPSYVRITSTSLYKLLWSFVKLRVKFLLDTKSIDSKNSDNSEVFCFCFCGYEVVYYHLFEN
jgi:hypothetical protein